MKVPSFLIVYQMLVWRIGITSNIYSSLFYHAAFGISIGGLRYSLSDLILSYFQYFQMGSLAGAAHLWNDSASVQRYTQKGQKPFVEEKAK